jgi:hypothetical protein
MAIIKMERREGTSKLALHTAMSLLK